MPEDNRYSDNRYSYISNQSNEESQRSTQHGNIKRLVCKFLTIMIYLYTDMRSNINICDEERDTLKYILFIHIE